jgi:hypothetical protein
MIAATRKTYANLSQETVRNICKRLGCPTCYARSFRLLGNHGEIHGEQFRALIRTPLGKRVINAICAELSKGLDHKFPPADYVAPHDYEYYVSPNASPRLATSAA